MNQSDKSVEAEQNLQLIRTMIDKARFNFSRGSFYFILWGSLLLASGVFEFVLRTMFESEWAFIGWPIVGISGGIASGIYGARSSKLEAITHLDRVYSSLWVTYFITLMILIISLVNQGVEPGAYIMIITGLPTALTGYILRFKPLLVGGVLFWVLGIASFFLPDGYRSLVFSFAVLVGYLIPGLMMKYTKQ